jgi:hypothetical protein
MQACGEAVWLEACVHALERTRHTPVPLQIICCAHPQAFILCTPAPPPHKTEHVRRLRLFFGPGTKGWAAAVWRWPACTRFCKSCTPPCPSPPLLPQAGCTAQVTTFVCWWWWAGTAPWWRLPCCQEGCGDGGGSPRLYNVGQQWQIQHLPYGGEPWPTPRRTWCTTRLC